MGLFDLFKKKPSEEEVAARTTNQQQLAEAFQPTTIIADRESRITERFFYDDQRKEFVITRGPNDAYAKENPWIVSADQVEKVSVEIRDYWAENYTWGVDPIRGFGQLLQERYDEVFWCYDVYVTIKTSHPYAKKIEFRLNEKSLVTKVPSKGFFVRRGLGVEGSYHGEQIAKKIDELKELADQEAKDNKGRKLFDMVTGNRPDGILEKMIADGKEDYRVYVIARLADLMQGAEDIRKCLEA